MMDMLTRMQTGRFKVFKHHHDWWEEFRLYHRKDGKVVKEGDDLMAATRYAIMSLRFASTKATYDSFRCGLAASGLCGPKKRALIRRGSRRDEGGGKTVRRRSFALALPMSRWSFTSKFLINSLDQPNGRERHRFTEGVRAARSELHADAQGEGSEMSRPTTSS